MFLTVFRYKLILPVVFLSMLFIVHTVLGQNRAFDKQHPPTILRVIDREIVVNGKKAIVYGIV